MADAAPDSAPQEAAAQAGEAGLLDTVLGDAISRVYRRARMRPTNPIPTYSDLRDELANWRSGDRLHAAVSDRSAHEV